MHRRPGVSPPGSMRSALRLGWTTLAHGCQWEWTSRGGCWRWLLFIMGMETGLFIML